MKVVKRKRKLKKWVKNTLEAIAMLVISFCLALGFIIGMGQVCDQRLTYYEELIANGN